VSAWDTPMNLALRMARRAYRMGEVPVGAVIFCRGEIIAAAHNYVEREQSPLAHAEILAILRAQSRLCSKYLDQCFLYVTLQPCPMCAHAIALARLKRVYFGAYESGSISPYPEWIGGVSETLCQNLLSSFFAEKR
jgi:tRNA(adenine34) deaminase